MKIEPYLFLNGRAEEALDFYVRALGAQVEMILRYDEAPEPIPPEWLPPGGVKKLMHASMVVEGQRIMMSDGVPMDGGGFRGFNLTLQYAAEADARRVFDALADGGKIGMPLAPTFFSPCFGQLYDRFGLPWMVMVDPATSPHTQSASPSHAPA